MRILHTSDLHGIRGSLIKSLENLDFDVWVDSGDFFPNLTHGIAETEVGYQSEWAAKSLKPIAETLIARNKPLISVPGNHDYISLVTILRSMGVEAYDLTESPVDLGGERFAGYREIPYIRGEWVGECHDFVPVVRNMLDQNPTVLVTHAPAAGFLDGDGEGHSHGVALLSSTLQYAPHSIKAHLFGHIHRAGGGRLTEMDIQFSNAATQLAGQIVVV